MGRVNYDYGKEPDPRGREYVVGVSDTVRVNVWGEPDMNVDARVRPDGTITVPLIGDVHAAGRTPSQIRNDIKEKMSLLYKQDTKIVTIAVPEVRSYTFTISGNAERPGRYSAERYVTVIEALSLAGGPNRFAETHKISVLRSDPANGRTKQIPIDYEKLRTGERLDQNIVVLAGDVILIP